MRALSLEVGLGHIDNNRIATGYGADPWTRGPRQPA